MLVNLLHPNFIWNDISFWQLIIQLVFIIFCGYGIIIKKEHLLAKVLEWTGNISYEVYLFHSIILVWLNYIFFGSSYFNYNNYRVISIIAFIFTLFISDLAYRFLEKKCFSFYGNVLIDKFELR